MSTKKQMTIEDKLVHWLSAERRTILTSHDLEDRFRPWLIQYYGRKGCLSIHRAWRQMRADGVFEVEELETSGEDGTWKILGYRGQPWTV